ncbi:MAG: hypothetical protein K0S24_2356 [Sphingobacterium sp.]|jgi:hypothetical protein|nr:hypothetical protein [Sphingobacterium sp.]
MKNTTFEKTFLFLFALTAVIFVALYYRGQKKLQAKINDFKALTDSILVLNDANRYYSDLLKFEIKSSDYPFEKDDIKLFNITQDTSKSTSQSLNSLIKGNKFSLILRYTEIGCNECSSITIKKLNQLKSLRPDLSIYALVDFSNYDSYLQWRKVGKINFPVYYLKKGGIAFDKDCRDYSYLFMIDDKSSASKFFIPNSGMPMVLDYYFDNLYNTHI